MFYLEVSLPVPLRQNYTYSCSHSVEAGCRVRVLFGRREMVGVVVSVTIEKPDIEKIKPVMSTLDRAPLISASLMSMARWLSDYYHHPLGETYSTVLPPWLRATRSSDEMHQLCIKPSLQITNAGKNARSELSSRHVAQARLLDQLIDKNLSQASARTLVSSATLKTLLEKEWIEVVNKPLSQALDWRSDLRIGERQIASTQQAAVIGAFCSQLDRFGVTLLEGVTGSGKTEVYLQIIEEVLLSGRQVLVLVPEIGLTPQTVTRFKQRFQCDIGVVNSQISDKERSRIWMKSTLGLLPLVIGTRSAVFTSFFDLGLIVIDEEHDDAFKQQDGLRYHARDVAIKKAKHENIPILLGSATPSLETLNNALNKRYLHMQLSQRAGGGSLVSQQLLDMREQSVTAGISEYLLSKMRKHLDENNQVMVFLNRRGFSPILICHSCGEVVVCKQCDRPMTYYKGSNQLRCHHCEIKTRVPKVANCCSNSQLMSEGLGTEQLEESLSSLFPDQTILRIDRDSASSKSGLHDILEAIHSKRANVLIGTQMLAKGHHFPDVTLVVIVDVDMSLFSNDIRSTEKLAQLVTQLSGRAGRTGKESEMWLQTHQPHHPLLQELINSGYGAVSRLLLAERKEVIAPPFCAQGIVRASHPNPNLVRNVLDNVVHCVKREDGTHLIGPIPALVEKKQGRFNMLLVVRTEDRENLYRFMRRAVVLLTADEKAKKVRWAVDVDAIDFT